MKLTFSQVADALAKTHNIASGKRLAFIARLQHLQKLKFPAGTNTGRGRAAIYDVGQLYLMGVALELCQLGLTPERAKKTVESDMHAVAMAAAMAARYGPPALIELDNPVFLYCDPGVLNSLVERDPEDDRAIETFFYAGMGQMLETFENWFKLGVSRMSFLSVSALVWSLAVHVSHDGKEIEAFYEALLNWADPYIHNQDTPDGNS